MPTTTSPDPARTPPLFIFSHGDKGGVGKSMVAMAIANLLMERGNQVAILDADTRNPDVSRMFADTLPTARMDLRSEDGWMDVMDFVVGHPEHTIIMNCPAGIGEYMRAEMSTFCNFLLSLENKHQLELWWTINLLPDSVNLLEEAFKHHGKFFTRTRVVRNKLFHSDEKAFFFWNESPLKAKIEKNGGITTDLPALHLRIMQRLFKPENMMPFTHAMDASIGESVGLSPAEVFKLKTWFSDVVESFTPALTFPANK